MFNWLNPQSPFKPTVDSIIRDLTQKIENLHTVKEAKHAASVVHDAIAAEAQKAAEEARKERDRALAIAEKLTSLIS